MKLFAPFLFSCFILILAFAILAFRRQLTPRRAWAMTAMAAIYWLSMELEWRIPKYFSDGIDSFFVAIVKVSSLLAVFLIFKKYVVKDSSMIDKKIEQREVKNE